MTASAAIVPARPATGGGTVLGFDYGEQRIGVAVGEPVVGIAHGVATIARPDTRGRIDAIRALVEEWHPERLVVGCPTTDDGSEHPLAPSIRRFVRRLHAAFGLPVETIDETLSSWEAAGRLAAAGVRGRAQKPHLDREAARAILETWFEEARDRARRP